MLTRFDILRTRIDGSAKINPRTAPSGTNVNHLIIVIELYDLIYFARVPSLCHLSFG
jgi:hypothetical protein